MNLLVGTSEALPPVSPHRYSQNFDHFANSQLDQMQDMEDVQKIDPAKCQHQPPASPGRAKTFLEKMSAFSASDFSFDLLGSPPFPADERGTVIRPMTLRTLPSLADQGVALTHLIIAPCTIGLPHYHPRGT